MLTIAIVIALALILVLVFRFEQRDRRMRFELLKTMRSNDLWTIGSLIKASGYGPGTLTRLIQPLASKGWINTRIISGRTYYEITLEGANALKRQAQSRSS
jgi:predicted transcriptional regulator